MSPPKSMMWISLNSRVAYLRNPSSCLESIHERFVMKASTPFAFSRSEAQRMKRLYISYCLVFCAVLCLT